MEIADARYGIRHIQEENADMKKTMAMLIIGVSCAIAYCALTNLDTGRSVHPTDQGDGAIRGMAATIADGGKRNDTAANRGCGDKGRWNRLKRKTLFQQ